MVLLLPQTLCEYPYWAKTRGWLESALEYTFQECTLDQIVENVLFKDWIMLGFFTGTQQSIDDYHGVIVAKTVEYQNKRGLRVLFMGGVTTPYWRQASEDVEKFARAFDLEFVEFWCRPDAVRAAEDILGYTYQYAVMIKEV